MADIDAPDPLSAASRALARGAWRQSRVLFQRALANLDHRHAAFTARAGEVTRGACHEGGTPQTRHDVD